MESIKNIKNWKVNEMFAINIMIIIIILFLILFAIILYYRLGPIIDFALWGAIYNKDMNAEKNMVNNKKFNKV
jgi:hypothetical protein